MLYRSAVPAFLCTRARRLDGYTLHSADGFRFHRNFKLVAGSLGSTRRSDGGTVLPKAIDAQIGLSERLGRALRHRGRLAQSPPLLDLLG